MKPGFHCVRAQWIRGFMTFRRSGPARTVRLMVPEWLKCFLWSAEGSARAGNSDHASVGAGAEQGPLALVTGERGGTAELLPGFLQPAQFGQQVAAYRGQVSVGCQGRVGNQLVRDLQAPGGAVRHAG